MNGFTAGYVIRKGGFSIRLGGRAIFAAFALLAALAAISIWSISAGDFPMSVSDVFAAAEATQWLTGSLNARAWRDVYTTGIGLAVLAPIALFLQISLDRLEMGDDMAAALGIRINLIRACIAIVGVLLVSLAVAAAGPIAFVALVAGPIARRLTDSSGPCLGTALLVGALVLISADLAGRLAFAPTQLPQESLPPSWAHHSCYGCSPHKSEKVQCE